MVFSQKKFLFGRLITFLWLKEQSSRHIAHTYIHSTSLWVGKRFKMWQICFISTIWFTGEFNIEGMYYTSSPWLVIHSLPSFEGLLGSKYVIWLRIWTLEVQQRTKIWQFLNHFCPLCTYSSTAAHHTYFTFTTKHQLVHIRAPWSKVLMTVQLEEQSDVWTMTLWAAWFVAERTCRSQTSAL